ncbi:hypothetical protein B7463_g9457, partial [Scytalidium lignicola]
MAVLSFSLNPEALSRLHDVLALLSVFKGRIVDSTREKDTGVEKCDVSVEDGDGRSGRNRFVIKIFCKHGVLKTYRLTFESVSPMHAVFARNSANNMWSISSKTLREFVEHFGPGTEQLDIYSENGRVSFTSYTEKVVSGKGMPSSKLSGIIYGTDMNLKEVLKQPLHTTIAIDAMEFAEFTVEERLHIVISVKDFKSIITHAGITNTNVGAKYSRPSSPMQLTYSDDGILSEFILMTIGESRGGSTTQISSRIASNRPNSRQVSAAPTASARNSSNAMPPPSKAPPAIHSREDSRAKLARPSPPPPQPSLQSKELFLPETDDDRRWDPANYEDEDEDDAMLLWDVNEVTNPSTTRVGHLTQTQTEGRNRQTDLRAQPEVATQLLPSTQRLAPTQRLSEVCLLSDPESTFVNVV